MQPWLRLENADFVKDRHGDADEEVHFTEGLAETVIGEYSAPGGVVLDPFAGFGTALVVAERMGRRAVGVELLDERVRLIRSRLTGDAEVVTGDARQVGALVRGPVELCFTSPPYMTVTDHPENPLAAYETLDGDYATYLNELGEVFRQVADLLTPGGHLVLNVANMTHDGDFTPLAWDVATAAGRHLTFRQETFLCWDRQPSWMTGDYCLVLQRPEAT